MGLVQPQAFVHAHSQVGLGQGRISGQTDVERVLHFGGPWVVVAEVLVDHAQVGAKVVRARAPASTPLVSNTASYGRWPWVVEVNISAPALPRWHPDCPCRMVRRSCATWPRKICRRRSVSSAAARTSTPPWRKGASRPRITGLDHDGPALQVCRRAFGPRRTRAGPPWAQHQVAVPLVGHGNKEVGPRRILPCQAPRHGRAPVGRPQPRAGLDVSQAWRQGCAGGGKPARFRLQAQRVAAE